jgi:hypothetical protein
VYYELMPRRKTPDDEDVLAIGKAGGKVKTIGDLRVP